MKNRFLLLILDISLLVLTVATVVWNVANSEILYAIASFISATCWTVFAVMIVKDI